MNGTVFPQSNELSAEEWIHKINTFPVNVTEVVISGGEPTIYFEFKELVTGLLANGYMVQVYSNLSNHKIINSLPKTDSLFFFFTFHHGEDAGLFDYKYQSVKHQKRVEEIDYGVLPYSKVKPFETFNWNTNFLRLNPNGEIFTTCEDRNLHDLGKTKCDFISGNMQDTAKTQDK